MEGCLAVCLRRCEVVRELGKGELAKARSIPHVSIPHVSLRGFRVLNSSSASVHDAGDLYCMCDFQVPWRVLTSDMWAGPLVFVWRQEGPIWALL